MRTLAIERLRHLGLAVLVLSPLGCSMPDGMNETCQWPIGVAEPGRRDIVEDVRAVEELAMRYADAWFDSKAAHGRLRSGCEEKLFARVAQGHGVPLSRVEQARQELDARVWDLPVHVPLAMSYVVVAVALARKVRRRFARDERIAAAIATVFTSVVIAIVYQVLGHLWDGVIEMSRVGSMHLSYRTERLGWRQYGDEVFVVSLLAFWGAVLFQYCKPTLNHIRQGRGTLTEE
jgi:hypothetical protein